MAEEEFHEIQLNGKQLVFLFMAGTVAAVVIFLCGLMVGRNLHVPRLEAAAATTETVTDPTRAVDDLPPALASTNDGTPPVTTREKLTYPEQLEAPKPVDEPLRDDPQTKRVEQIAKAAPEAARPAPAAAKPTPAAPKPGAAEKALASAEPGGEGWTVQVQAVNSREEADAIARRLNAKNYPAFVTQTGSGNLVKYRIRVGKYPKKQDAETMKTRLERQEQFKPWVTR
jgi:cell division septation protein DedD